LAQFLIEALFMSLIGGLVGILLGWGISEIAGQLTDELQPVMQMNTILLATGFAGSVGTILGFIPPGARRVCVQLMR
jgi:ABC-type antimicrobial peptide transport system permease subunit